MSTQHTPGPWEAVYIGCGDWDLKGPVTREDWYLAAAAPEMLETLKRLREMCFDFGAYTACDIAAAVIAKATGDQA